MLTKIFLTVGPQVSTCWASIFSMKVNRVEFVVTQNSTRFTRLHKAADSGYDASVLGTAIDEVPKKHDFTARLVVAPTCRTSGPAERLKKPIQLVGVTMDIGNNIKHVGCPCPKLEHQSQL